MSCLTERTGLGIREIRSVIASSIRYISIQGKLPNGSRKITEIAELSGINPDGHYIIQPLIKFENGKFEITPAGSKLITK